MPDISDKQCRIMCLFRQHLQPEVYGNTKNDVLKIIEDIGGLLWGRVVFNSYYIELWGRFDNFQRNWIEELIYEKKELVEMHVLRVGLRIITVKEAPYYFQATREVIKRAGWPLLNSQSNMKKVHKNIIHIMKKNDPLTFRELKKKFLSEFSSIFSKTAFEQLLHTGTIIRVARKGITPLFGLTDVYFPDMGLYEVKKRDAKAWVALKCLEAYGPFSTHDISHWVGWTVKETEEILQFLAKKGEVTTIDIKSREEIQWIRSEDISFLKEILNYETKDFSQILSYEDELMNGYSLMLPSSFGYPLRGSHRQHLPILNNHEIEGPKIIGDIKLQHDYKKQKLVIKDIYLQKKYNNIVIKNRIRERLEEFSSFHSAELILESSNPYIVY